MDYYQTEKINRFSNVSMSQQIPDKYNMLVSLNN